MFNLLKNKLFQGKSICFCDIKYLFDVLTSERKVLFCSVLFAMIN